MTRSLEDVTRQLVTKTREVDAPELSRVVNENAVDQLQTKLDSGEDALGQCKQR